MKTPNFYSFLVNLQRYDSGYTNMSPEANGAYVSYDDVVELLNDIASYYTEAKKVVSELSEEILDLNRDFTSKQANTLRELSLEKEKVKTLTEALRFYAPMEIDGISFAGGVDNGHRAKNALAKINVSESLSDIVTQVFEVSDSINDDRKLSDIIMYAMTELGECAEEALIESGYSTKKAGPDGVVGEAVDTIICLLDAIRIKEPELTRADIEFIFQRKLAKWKRKSNA